MTSTDQTSEVAAADAAAKVSDVVEQAVDQAPNPHATAEQVEAARATRATQSMVDAGDKETYTPGYILRHPAATALLFVRSVVKNGDHYIRTLVGGSLSYYTVELAWGWVAVLYLLLAYAALPVQGAKQLLTGRARGWCCAAAATLPKSRRLPRPAPLCRP